MSVNLTKGQKISLTKEAPALDKLLVGLGWDVNTNGGRSYDLDAHVFLLNDKGKLPSSGYHIYYGNLKYKDAIKHCGDNLTGAGDGDDEQVKINLNRIPANVERILISVIIYQGRSRGQSFKNVENAFIHIDAGNTEICRYNLSEKFNDEVEVEVAEFYRHDGEWKFKAIGQGFNKEQSR